MSWTINNVAFNLAKYHWSGFHTFTTDNKMRLPVLLVVLLLTGCAATSTSHPTAHSPPPEPQIEAASSPEGDSRALVLKAIRSAQTSIRLATYSFTSLSVVRELIDADRRGVKVQMMVDERGNYKKGSMDMLKLVSSVDIPIRTISTYANPHGEYIVVDGKHVQVGSLNLGPASSGDSGNVVVIWNSPGIAASLTKDWEYRFAKGEPFRTTMHGQKWCAC